MTLPPKDYTKQEQIIAECLNEFGIRFEQQYDFYPYTTDFYIPDLNMVVEADGKYGHLKKRDIQRDLTLVTKYEVSYILHIKDSAKKQIERMLWLGLNKLEKEENQLNQNESA